MSLLDNLDGEIEQEKILSSKDNSQEQKLEELLKRYEKWLNLYVRDFRVVTEPETNLTYNLMLDESDINLFLHRAKKYETHRNFWETGIFVSAMIQNAYDKGHNDFKIIVSETKKPIKRIASYLSGKKDRIMKLNLPEFRKLLTI